MHGSLIKQQIGRYHVEALIGRGGMAAVYRARDSRLQRDVALKLLYPQYGDDPLLVERFKREAITAAGLEHPAIVPIYDIGEQDGFVFIAMKLLPGRSLADLLRERATLPLPELLAVLAPLAAALDYAHSRGVVHRDIKPANILLINDEQHGQPTAAPSVMLSDFGIAKVLDAPGMTTTGALIGTPEYMAPEQIGNRPVDGRSDVYSLGLLAYRALAGRLPFAGSTQEVLMAHLHDQVPPPSSFNPQLTPAVDQVLLRATARDPAARYAAAGAFVADLAATNRVGTLSGASPLLRQPALPDIHQQLPVPQALPTPVAPAEQQPVLRPTATSTDVGRPVRRGGLALVTALATVLAIAALSMALFSLWRGGTMLPPTPIPPLAGVDTPTTAPGVGAAPEPTAPPTPEPAVTAVPSATTTTDPAANATPTPAASASPPSPIVMTSLVTAIVTATPRPPAPEPPTATSLSPTAVPTGTPTPSPTAAPPATTTSCPIAASRGFGKIYAENPRVRERLGCATSQEQTGVATQQFFAAGTMYYWQPTEEIFVFLDLHDGAVEIFTEPEVAALPELDPPPAETNAPPGGFGRIYYNLPEIRDQIGAPLSPMELLQPYGVIQPFQDGIMVFTPDYRGTGKNIFVVYNDGSFERYVDTFQD
jgi:serine/threonine protein kinase